uniref:Chemokine ligand 34b n=1 Tax=Ctenopharyngodon idella TaxID=7959 RepID=A0A345D755_CTEID|nr:chemokine ligand 34b [Ctenopharyngodon idella]
METQRILMRSLAVVVVASVIWTITDADNKVNVKHTCCTVVSTAELTDTITGFRMQNESLPCVKAIM